MALVSDIQLQDKTVKPHTIDVDCHFTFAGLTASTALAISETVPVSTTGLFTAKSANNVCAFFETASNNVDIYLNIDKATDDPTDNPYWALRASGTASDSFIIANSKGANSTCQYSALSITPAGGVGVGKTGATSVLDISAADSSTASINITNTTDNVGAKLSTGSSSIAMGSTTNHNLNLQTNSVDRVTLDISGNLGIGTVTPGALLDVRGSAVFNEDAAEVDFRVEGGTVENLLFVDGSADKIGIGTATPSELVHIQKNSNAATAVEIENTTNDTAAVSKLVLTSGGGLPGAGVGTFTSHNSSFTTNNQAIADSVLLESQSTSSGGLQLSAAGTNEVGLWTNSTRRATLTSGGCLGLGVSTPDGLLHIYSGNAGSVAASSGGCNLVIENSAHGGVSILTPDASTGSIIFGSPSDSIGAEIKHTQSSTTMEVGTRESGGILKLNSDDGTNAIYIDASQNVGIGTDSSSVPLRVQGDACFTGTLTAAQLSGGGSSLWLSGTDLIYTTGNCIGIGTSAATADLHIMKDQNATTDILIANNTAGTAAISQLNVSSDTALGHLTTFSGTYTTSGSSIADAVRLGSDSTASGGLHISAGGTNEIGFWTNDTRKVTITSGGCVGIGTADTDDEELKVEGDICTTGTMYAQAFSGGGVTDNVWIMNGQDAYYKELSAGDNIGLGTTTPGHTLHVGGNAASAPALLVCDSGGAKIEVNNGQVKIHNAICLPSTDGTVNQVLCTDGSGALGWGPGGYWGCDGSANLNYTSGNIGIGTATPSHTLDVEGVAHAATCMVSANVCATTKVVSAYVWSSGVLCSSTSTCVGTCVVAGGCVSGASLCSREATCVGTCLAAGTVCASSALTVAAGTVAGAPSGTSDITPKCYVDAEVAAGGAKPQSVCCCCMSGSWSVPTGVEWVWVSMIGAGGGGAGGNYGNQNGGNSGQDGGGGGGGGGGPRQIYWYRTWLGGCTSIPICGPTGGAGGAAQACGSAGNNASFGCLCSAGGNAGNIQGNACRYGCSGGAADDTYCFTTDDTFYVTNGLSKSIGFDATFAGRTDGGTGGNATCCGTSGAAGGSGLATQAPMSNWFNTSTPNCRIAGAGTGGAGGANTSTCGTGGGGGGGGGSFYSWQDSNCWSKGGCGGNCSGGAASGCSGGPFGMGGGGGGGAGLGTTNAGSGGTGGPGMVLIHWTAA